MLTQRFQSANKSVDNQSINACKNLTIYKPHAVSLDDRPAKQTSRGVTTFRIECIS